MKSIIFSILALSLMIGTMCCQETINIEEEKKAIIAVLEEESAGIINQDFARLSETWIQDETVNYIGSGKISYSNLVGWDEISPRFKEAIESNPDPIYTKMVKANFKIKVFNKSAWANYNEINYNNEGNIANNLLINKILENVDDEWKIVFTSVVVKSSWEEEVEKEEESEE